MAKVVFGMTMSVDGYVNDRNGSTEYLSSDLDALRRSEMLREIIAATGAVVMGRRSFEMAEDPDWYVGNYEFQVPIFVLGKAPEKLPEQDDRLTFTFATEGVESAIAQAKAAAGDRDVTVVGGATTGRQLLAAGLVDELHLDIQPVLLGGGLRLFEQLDAEIQLEKIDVDQEIPGRTSLRFRVVKP